MIAKLSLSMLFVGLMSVGLVQTKSAKRIGLFIIGISAMALLAIWNEAAVTQIANAVGVGRGTDFVLYLWIPVSLAFALLLYLRILGLERMITQLARHIALSQPVQLGTDAHDH